MERLRIGAVAKRGGVNLGTIRYYERQRLLPEPPRTASGYRIFGEDAVNRVRFIKRAQELGFSLNEIRELLALRAEGRRSCAGVRERAEAKITDVKKKIRALEQLKAALERITASCTGEGPVSECPILEYLNLRDGSQSRMKKGVEAQWHSKKVKSIGVQTRSVGVKSP